MCDPWLSAFRTRYLSSKASYINPRTFICTGELVKVRNRQTLPRRSVIIIYSELQGGAELMRTTSLPCGEVSRMRDLQIVCRSAWADFHLFSVTLAMQSKTDGVSFLSRRLVLTVSVALRDGCSGFYRAMLCIARTMPSQDVCLSVWLSVRLSHAGILSKRIYISSTFFTTG